MRSRFLAGVFALLLFPALAGAAHHEAGEAVGAAKAWDQEAVTQLSDQLWSELGALRDAFRKDPQYRDGVSTAERAAHQLEGTLKHLETSARQLRDQVKAGKNMEETTPVAQKIGSLLRDADVESSKLMTTKWTQDRVKPVMETLNQIAPYYGSGPLYDPETMERVAP